MFVFFAFLPLLFAPLAACVGLELDQPISVSCAENFTIAWRDARGVAAAQALFTPDPDHGPFARGAR